MKKVYGVFGGEIEVDDSIADVVDPDSMFGDDSPAEITKSTNNLGAKHGVACVITLEDSQQIICYIKKLHKKRCFTSYTAFLSSESIPQIIKLKDRPMKIKEVFYNTIDLVETPKGLFKFNSLEFENGILVVKFTI